MDLSAFQGDWSLDREVEDYRSGETSAFGGTARFRAVADGLDLIEEGRWTRASWGALAASRRYIWRRDGEGIEVLYADGRPFHRFIPAGHAPVEALHHCEPDIYEVTYRFDLPDSWSAEWRVRGPAKDYLSRTIYRR
ncbi:DUF6314 family protein [Pelagovum pacificum]|uniref:Trigger factor n=1 Tax=Pelagovum pacificum TaxID=2588711 RepID=A0A5C5GF54_9RHOB|nr:DUF6314 family protein [Pelagovum pacificum]QQA44287.1 trigger factor [Pelagovum pacificum]TNY32591.1 trigger factor [Pelagovum pacificum]